MTENTQKLSYEKENKQRKQANQKNVLLWCPNCRGVHFPENLCLKEMGFFCHLSPNREREMERNSQGCNLHISQNVEELHSAQRFLVRSDEIGQCFGQGLVLGSTNSHSWVAQASSAQEMGAELTNGCV